MSLSNVLSECLGMSLGALCQIADTQCRISRSASWICGPSASSKSFILALVSNLAKSGLGSEGVCGFISNVNSMSYELQKVRTYIRVDFALVDDGFHLPNVEKPQGSWFLGFMNVEIGCNIFDFVPGSLSSFCNFVLLPSKPKFNTRICGSLRCGS